MQKNILRKSVVIGIIILFLVASILPNISASLVSDNSTEKLEINANRIDIPALFPRLFMKIVFSMDYEITKVQASIKFHIGERIYNHLKYDKYVYIGNVKIEGKFSDLGSGYAYSAIARIFMFFPINPIFFPGCYEFEENFTIQARYLVLYENTSYWAPPTLIGYGFFVRVS